MKIISGDIFESECETLCNPCNIFGVGGGGLSYEFKHRYPAAFQTYLKSCKSGNLKIGNLSFHRSFEIDTKNKTQHNVLHFPTKDNFIYPSKIEIIEAGLKKFTDSYKQLEIKSIAFPSLGCGLGTLNFKEVKPLMERYLKDLDIEIEVFIPKD